LRWLWRTTPLHGEFGCYYGTPVDRIYIEEFLARHRQDIRGRVLEIGDDTYSRRFGSSQVEHVDVLHAISGNPQATIVADLTDAPHIPDAHFDCIILTQTLQCIYDFRSALATLRRILRPGGVLLVTIPGVSHQISREERPYWGDYWRWTSMAAERSFGEVFPAGSFSIETRGNVLIAMALLQGLVAEELRPQDFEAYDPEYEVSILIRAVQLG
jgi:SAM-dependent methyltransferase